MASQGNAARIQILLQGARQAIAGLVATAGAVGTLGTAIATSNREMETSSKRGWLMNQAMFTMRRFAYAGTLAITAMAGSVVGLGFKFDMMRETSLVAFGTLLQSTSAAQREMNFLFDLAARSPFEFQGVQQAARYFLGWGFTVKEVNKDLKIMADVIAGMGGNTSVMEPVVRAFGQMRSAGVVRMQDLMQLQQAIPGVMGILQKQLNLPPRVLANIGAYHINANDAIAAIMRGLAADPRFKNASEKLARTVQGQLSSLHDYGMRLFGDIMLAPFKAFQKRMPGVIETVNKMDKGLKKGGFSGMIAALDKGVGGGGRVIAFFNMLSTVTTSLARIFSRVLWPAIKDVGVLVGGALFIALNALAQVLSFVSHHTLLLRIFTTYLLAIWMTEKSLMIILLVLGRRRILLRLAEYAITRTVTAATILYNLAMIATNREVRLLVLSMLRYQLSLTRTGRLIIWTVTQLRILGAEAMLRGRFVWGSLVLMARGMMNWVRWTRIAIITAWQMRRALIAQAIAAIRSAAAARWAMIANSSLGLSVRNLIRFYRFLPFVIWSSIRAMAMYIREMIAVALMQARIALSMALDWAIAFWPISLAVVAVAALGYAFLKLYQNWDWVVSHIKQGARWVLNFFKREWPWILGAILGPFGLAGVAIYKHFDSIKRWAMDVWKFIRNIFGRIGKFIAGVWNKIPGHGLIGKAAKGLGNLVGLADGGRVTSSGAFLVGERGPEIAVLPAGATIAPTRRGSAVPSPVLQGLPDTITINQPIYLDGKKIADNSAKHHLTAEGRR